MRSETGPRKNQHVKVRGYTNTGNIDSPNELSLLRSYCDRNVKIIGGFRGGAEGGPNPIFQNVNVTLLCITNTPTMLYAACPEK